MNEYLDKTGRTICKGNYLVQAQRAGNSARLVIGRVVAVDERGVKVRNTNHTLVNGKHVITLKKAAYIECLDRCLVAAELIIPNYYVDALKDVCS
jgi:hypothetical protein